MLGLKVRADLRVGVGCQPARRGQRRRDSRVNHTVKSRQIESAVATVSKTKELMKQCKWGLMKCQEDNRQVSFGSRLPALTALLSAMLDLRPGATHGTTSVLCMNRGTTGSTWCFRARGQSRMVHGPAAHGPWSGSSTAARSRARCAGAAAWAAAAPAAAAAGARCCRSPQPVWPPWWRQSQQQQNTLVGAELSFRKRVRLVEAAARRV